MIESKGEMKTKMSAVLGIEGSKIVDILKIEEQIFLKQ